MDTQGSEARILEGMSALIEGNRERLAIIMEFAPGLLTLSGFPVSDFAAKLRTSGAKVYATEQQSGRVALRELTSFEDALESRAASLLEGGREDESENLLVFFSNTSRQVWLDRLNIGEPS